MHRFSGKHGVHTHFSLLKERLPADWWRAVALDLGSELDGTAAADANGAKDDVVRLGRGCRTEYELAEQVVQYFATNADETDLLIPSAAGERTLTLLSTLPHLPAHLRVVNRCFSVTSKVYERMLPHRERVSRMVTTTPRQRRDLCETYGVEEEKLALIPHGTPFAELAANERNAGATTYRSGGDTLRLGYVGRLLHKRKGVFLLHAILKELRSRGVRFTLEIAGRGPDEAALRLLLRPWVREGTVRFHGALEPERMSAFYRELDVLLFPSYKEGFGFVSIEAMAHGVVPVVSEIAGVLDWIVEHERTGLVCPVGHPQAFAAAAAELFEDRGRLVEFGEAARGECERRFAAETMVASYARLFDAVCAEPLDYAPRPLSEWRTLDGRPLKRWTFPRLKGLFRPLRDRIRIRPFR